MRKSWNQKAHKEIGVTRHVQINFVRSHTDLLEAVTKKKLSIVNYFMIIATF